MDLTAQMIISICVLAGAGIGVWVAMNNKVTRLETKVEMLEKNHDDYKSQIDKSMSLLRNEMLQQFSILRDDIHKISGR